MQISQRASSIVNFLNPDTSCHISAMALAFSRSNGRVSTVNRISIIIALLIMIRGGFYAALSRQKSIDLRQVG